MHLPTVTRKQLIIASVIVISIVLLFLMRSRRSNYVDLPATDTSAAGVAFATYQTAAKTVYDYFDTWRLAPGGTAIAGYNKNTGKCDPANTACVAITDLRAADLAKVIAWYVGVRAPGLYDSSPINCPRNAALSADAPSVLGMTVTMPAAPLTASGTASATNKGYVLNFTTPPAPGDCPATATAATAVIQYTGA
jgi:hypothetical protein